MKRQSLTVFKFWKRPALLCTKTKSGHSLWKFVGCLSRVRIFMHLLLDQHPNKKIRENSAMAPSSTADFSLSMLHSTHAWLQRGCIEISGTGPVPRIESEEHGSIAFKWAISLRFRIPQTLHFTPFHHFHPQWKNPKRSHMFSGCGFKML